MRRQCHARQSKRVNRPPAGRAITYLNGEFSEEAQSFGAFCTRVVLENACAALVGRLDPFRLLYLAEFQAQGGFEYGRPAKSGFKWTGDVFSGEKPSPKLWSTEHDLSKISRALFSPHVDHVFLPGHRSWCMIQWSWSPLYDRNPQRYPASRQFHQFAGRALRCTQKRAA